MGLAVKFNNDVDTNNLANMRKRQLFQYLYRSCFELV